jgi:hypothetical protein
MGGATAWPLAAHAQHLVASNPAGLHSNAKIKRRG